MSDETPLIEKTLDTPDGEVTVYVQDDENRPVVLSITCTVTGEEHEVGLTQENTRAMKAWLDAALKLQRWC